MKRDSRFIFGLFNLGVSQPLYSVLSLNQQFLVVHDIPPADLFLLILVISFVLPTLMITFQFLAGCISKGFQKGVSAFLFAALAGTVLLPLLKHFHIPGILIILIAASVGLALFCFSVRFAPVGVFFHYLIPVALIVPGLFLYKIWGLGLLSQKLIPAFPPPRSTTPVVLILLDELPLTSILDRNREIDPVKYPNFARLARQSVWFRNATTISPDTPVAISAILTGNYPHQEKFASVRDYPANLFTLFGSSYDLRVVEPVTKLCPYQTLIPQQLFAARFLSLLKDVLAIYIQAVVPPDFAHRFPQVTSRWSHFWSRDDPEFRTHSFQERTRQFSVFVSSLQKTNKPGFYFLHLLLPHGPWRYLPSGKRYDPPQNPVDERSFENSWKRDPESIQRGYQRHLLQVGFVDRLLGQVLDKLQETGLYERSLIVVTSDHGICFRYKELRRDVKKSNAVDLLPVVLLMKLPDRKNGTVTDRNVESIDILPTIADTLGVSVPWTTDGSSAFNVSVPERERKQAYPYYSSAPLVFPRKLELSFPVFPDPNAKWIGGRVTEFAIRDAGDVTFELINQEAFDHVDLQSDFVPALISGRIRYGRESPRRLLLAVAVNGVIRATGNTFPINPKVDGFSVIVPEGSFHPGQNHVDLFEISSEDKLDKLNRR